MIVADQEVDEHPDATIASVVELGASSYADEENAVSANAFTVLPGHSPSETVFGDPFTFQHILRFVDDKSLARLAGVSSSWDKAANAHSLWKLHCAAKHRGLVEYALKEVAAQEHPKLLYELTTVWERENVFLERRPSDCIQEAVELLKLRNLLGRPQSKLKKFVRYLCSPYLPFMSLWMVLLSVAGAQVQLEVGDILGWNLVLAPLYLITLVWLLRAYALYKAGCEWPFVLYFYDSKHFHLSWLTIFLESLLFGLWVCLVIFLDLYLDFEQASYGDLLQICFSFFLIVYLIASAAFYIANKSFTTKDQQFFIIECVLLIAYMVSWIDDELEFGGAVYDTYFNCVASFLIWGGLMAMVDKRFWDLVDEIRSSWRIIISVVFLVLLPLVSATLLEGKVNYKGDYSWFISFIPFEVFCLFWGCFSTMLVVKSWKLPESFNISPLKSVTPMSTPAFMAQADPEIESDAEA
eukprot:TRINITY_DN11240_c0_g1_i2.p1 TRINITY_DN11240_c0_g1~~TRINITY_DN11240_c0_g1_i2.p1  ORF type:complete len:467 (+),score=111.24 TRINITY_DN11240_c0_g1_i2:1139-2539(+)